MSTIRRPDLHYKIHNPTPAPSRKRGREEEDRPEELSEEAWNTEDETSDDCSDYSVYSDDDDDDENGDVLE